MDPTMDPFRRLRWSAATALLAIAAVAAPAMAQQWDMVAGGYHTHLIFHADRFELHLHDKATHRVIETTRGRYRAVLSTGGRRVDVPLTSTQAGILVGRPVPSGDWTLEFRVEGPGAAPADLRYTAKMKPGVQPAQGAAGKPEKSGGHAHHH